MISDKLLKYWYPIEKKRDGTLIFYNWIREHTNAEQYVLNLGAGPASGVPLKVFRGEVRRVVGVDVDPIVLENSELDEARVVDGRRLPFGEKTFDIVFCDYVLEHVEFPERFMMEVFRILKPGGSFFFRTPNKYHYVSLIAHFTPHWVHELVANRARGLPSDAHEPYQAFHRLNTKAEILALAKKAGFSEQVLRFVECQPSYLMFSAIPFLAGVIYERTVNRFDNLSQLRSNIFGRVVR